MGDDVTLSGRQRKDGGHMSGMAPQPQAAPATYGAGRDEANITRTISSMWNIWSQLSTQAVDLDDQLSNMSADDLANLWAEQQGLNQPTAEMTQKANDAKAGLQDLRTWCSAGQSGTAPATMPNLGYQSRAWRTFQVIAIVP
jgi:hypothetical protein